MIASWVVQLLVALTILWLALGSIVLLDYVGWLWQRRSMWLDAEREKAIRSTPAYTSQIPPEHRPVSEAERNALAERIRAKWPHRGPS